MCMDVMPACVSVCHMSAEPLEVRKGHQALWNWSWRWLSWAKT